MSSGKSPFPLLFLALSGLLAGTSLPADELIMKDGSRLVGKVVRDEGQTLDFETGFAGTIRVKLSEISELRADESVRVLMENGELLEVVVIDKSGDAAVIEMAGGETREVDAGEVAYLNPAPWRLGEGYRWTGNVNTDLKAQRGNTDKEEFEVDFKTQFRRLQDRARLEGQYEKDKNNGDLTDENWILNGKYDRFISEKFYYGATLGLEHDKFSDLDLRTIIGPHIGYQFHESPEMNLGTDFGIMYVDEDFIESPDDDYIALGWHVNFDRFLVPERIQFYHRHYGLLDTGDIDNLVINSWTGFRFPLYAGIVASAEAEIEYDGGAVSGVDKTDTTYRFKLGYIWE